MIHLQDIFGITPAKNSQPHDNKTRSTPIQSEHRKAPSEKFEGGRRNGASIH
jgi:hypothetical protein